ncbi:hypothetical protein BS50DRAFT_535969 [Corynespora cassiicola Philippines]|uniref:Protein HRI1 n=1 Tax=Corynespora cassiicola Philippines TaxID=1448308 RepID=A0A2T2N4X2_CORCC|nr:hypothetical protein BS50DRAFT_535969 [Corynespora cassiicola Philippines]
MASISIRESIRWLPGEASEPTSTLVLTSPGKRFVDLRILHPTKDDATDEDIVPLERLDWAIAGTSSSVATPDRGPDTTHSQWKHWIDSRTLDVASATDEGFMSPLGSGRTLEEGNMANPDTGVPTDYEEIWMDTDPEPVPDDDGPQICVLRFQGQGEGERGSVVRLGKLCQGLLREGDEIRAERWEWEVGRGWKRTKRIGNGAKLPCNLILGPQTLAEGQVFDHEGNKWTVMETGVL